MPHCLSQISCSSYRDGGRPFYTDSFIAALLRFTARRGPPFSDNGTNFHGAETDVLKALQAFDQEKIRHALQKRQIEWNFNPPGASHQGGSVGKIDQISKKNPPSFGEPATDE